MWLWFIVPLRVLIKLNYTPDCFNIFIISQQYYEEIKLLEVLNILIIIEQDGKNEFASQLQHLILLFHLKKNLSVSRIHQSCFNFTNSKELWRFSVLSSTQMYLISSSMLGSGQMVMG